MIGCESETPIQNTSAYFVRQFRTMPWRVSADQSQLAEKIRTQRPKKPAHSLLPRPNGTVADGSAKSPRQAINDGGRAKKSGTCPYHCGAEIPIRIRHRYVGSRTHKRTGCRPPRKTRLLSGQKSRREGSLPAEPQIGLEIESRRNIGPPYRKGEQVGACNVPFK